MNINDAIMCCEASEAVYLEWDDCESALAQYVDKSYTTKMFDNDGAQAYAFKMNATTAVIAFRGTEEKNDIWADLAVWKESSTVAGDVHYGFKREIDKIHEDIMVWIRSRAINKETTIFVTGHSLGAAMASIFTARLTELGYNVILYTFGSPRVGDKKWANFLKDVPVYRFVNTNDIVTRIPKIGYDHVGEMYYLGYDGGMSTGRSFWKLIKDNIKARIKAWKKGQAFSGFYDHLINNYLKKLKSNV